MAESFYCFYPTHGFWAGTKPSLAPLMKGGTRPEDILSERTVLVTTAEYSIAFCKDGMCMLGIGALNRQMDNVQTKESEARLSIDRKRRLSLQWLSVYNRYVQYLNVMQLLLDAALTETYPIPFFDTAVLRPCDVFPVIVDDSRLWPVMDYSSTDCFHASRDKLRKGRRDMNYSSIKDIENDSLWISRREVSEGLLRGVIAQFDAVWKDPRKVGILNQALVAIDNFNSSNHAIALVQSWFMIELFINMKWVEFLSERSDPNSNGVSRIDKDRLGFLTGRDFTAAVVANVLELNDRIPITLLKKIDVVRKRRNEISHSLDECKRLVGEKLKGSKQDRERNEVVTADDCLTAFEVVQEFLTTQYSLDLKLGLYRKSIKLEGPVPKVN